MLHRGREADRPTHSFLPPRNVPLAPPTWEATYRHPFVYKRGNLAASSNLRAHYAFVSNHETLLTLLNFTDEPPKSTLDVGCGSGNWILRAASEWTGTEFVGFDLLPIQPSSEAIEDSILSRISWINGNFLERWPFADETFDHVRVSYVATGVPEHMWNHFCSEMTRVLTVGGHVEFYEEDIVFPRPLPPSDEGITPNDFRPGTPDSFRSDSSSGSVFHTDAPPANPYALRYDPSAGYDDDVLEALYFEIHQRKGINLRPTAVIPLYLSGVLRSTVMAPVCRIPVPSLGEATIFPRLPVIIGDPAVGHDPATFRRPGGAQKTFFIAPVNFGTSKRPKLWPPQLVSLDSSALITNLRIAIDHVLAAKEAIWDWIVEMETWECYSERDPVIIEARTDLEYAFRVYSSRFALYLASNPKPTPLTFNGEGLAHASNFLDRDDNSISAQKCQTSAGSQVPESPHAAHTNLSRSTAQNPSSTSSHTIPRTPAIETPWGPTTGKLSDEHDKNTVRINAVDVEDTIPHASRVLRLFYGIKGNPSAQESSVSSFTSKTSVDTAPVRPRTAERDERSSSFEAMRKKASRWHV